MPEPPVDEWGAERGEAEHALDRGLAAAFGPSSVPRESVIGRLQETLGPLPRVLLRDTEMENGPGPMVQTGSADILALGDRPARLQVLGEIARGGMGAVLRGHDTDLGRDLAVKVLREDHGGRPELARRFVEEAQIAGQLQHPGVVPVYELGCFADRRPFFTMKLVKGRTLAQLLNDRPTPQAERPRFLGIFEQVCQTVAYAHARGVIHRDLKPSNVMVGAFGEVQVMDWGLAKVLPRGGAVDDAAAGRATPIEETVIATARSGSDSDLSRAGSVLGTPSYMAPEQARGEIEQVDERADVFALGSILCEILTGRPAYTGRNSGEIQRKASRADLTEARARLDTYDADDELKTLTHNCLAIAPEDRPRDASAVVARLVAHLEGVQARLRAAEVAHAAQTARAEEAVRTAEAAEARSRAEARARRLTAALAAALIGLVAVGGGGAAWLQRQRATRLLATTRAVNDALADAIRLEGEARAAGVTDDVRKWDAALAEARRADDLLRQGEADAALRGRVDAAISTLKEGRTKAAASAERIRVDRELLAALEAAGGRIGTATLELIESGDRDAAAAFRAAGLDIDRTEAKVAGAWIAARSAPVELAIYVDAWAKYRRYLPPGGNRKPWKHLVEVARAADPDPWRDTLRAGCLGDPAALTALADDPEGLAARSAMSLNVLGCALKDFARDPVRAERVLRLAWSQDPEDYWSNLHLAEALAMKKPSDPEQLAAWRAERLRFATAALAARPQNPWAFDKVAEVLGESGRFAEAIAVFRGKQKRHPGHMSTAAQLGFLLLNEKKTEEGVAELREAVRQVGGPLEYYYLGLALRDLGRIDEAVDALREAVRLDGQHVGQAIFHLGLLYRRLGKYEEAAATFRRAGELAQVEGAPEQVERAKTELTRVESWKALEERLPELIASKDRPSGSEELHAITEFCQDRRLYAAGARVCEAAFQADPSLADPAQLRLYDAGRLGIQAGFGLGTDAPPPNDAEKARLRALALGWLRAQVAGWKKSSEEGSAAERKKAAGWVDLCWNDADLARARLPISLAKLPAPEQEQWRTFWAEVDALRLKAAGAAR